MKSPLAAFLLAAATFAYSLTLTAADRPNVILVMADDQGWGDMHYNGHPVLKTPHFDRMAAEALRFDRFYAAAPVCSPTRASVLTGRHPNRQGIFKWGYPLRPQEITVAEALKTAGYATGHFGKWHLGSVRKGSPSNPGACGFDEWLSAENYYDNDSILSREGTAVQMKGESSFIAVDAAIEFMEKHNKEEQPFLAVVWFGSPHGPHRAAPEDKAIYASEPEKLQDFYGEITGMDRALGKLRKRIADLGIHENTILWYTSDNGGLKVESSGGRGKKGQVYEGGLRVPSILEWPAKIAKPRVTDVLANSSDIYPTILEIAGVTMENQPPLDGISLVPVIAGAMTERPGAMGFWDYGGVGGISTPSDAWMKVLLETQASGSEPDDPEKLHLDAGVITDKYVTEGFPGHAAWRDGDWKLHRIEDSKDQSVTWELYNLGPDAMEENDLADKEAKRVKKMKKALEAWLTSVRGSLNGSDYESQ